MPDRMLNGDPWPTVSIVTPSYNQGPFLEETIRSVLLQGYPNLEYMVIDGGSTDNSVDIIRKYEPWLASWVSEPDSGQSDAINKGLEASTGEVFCWLNSDDLYVPGALATIARAYEHSPGNIVAGSVLNVQQGLQGTTPGRLHIPQNLSLPALLSFWDSDCVWHQPGLFFPSEACRGVGGLNVTLRYTMDYDLLCRLLQQTSVTYVPHVVAHFRLHEGSKTVSQFVDLGMFMERFRVSKSYWHLDNHIDRPRAYAYCTDFLVRWAGTHALAGRLGPAIRYLSIALSVHPVETAKAVLSQFAAGVRRAASGQG
jgi:glycosyltransferase involved in cell wall biosynthesis